MMITKGSQIITLNVSVKKNLKWKEKFKMFFLGYFSVQIGLDIEVFSNGNHKVHNSEVLLTFHSESGDTHYPEDNTIF